uniref:Uncharacterized protein n=1 Tax=Solanum tuberosum TaxID=4113 RepID=M1DYQ3_SOLTU
MELENPCRSHERLRKAAGFRSCFSWLQTTNKRERGRKLGGFWVGVWLSCAAVRRRKKEKTKGGFGWLFGGVGSEKKRIMGSVGSWLLPKMGEI